MNFTLYCYVFLFIVFIAYPAFLANLGNIDSKFGTKFKEEMNHDFPDFVFFSFMFTLVVAVGWPFAFILLSCFLIMLGIYKFFKFLGAK